MADRDRLGPLQRLHRRAGLLAIRLADVLRPRLSLGVRLVALDGERRVFLVRHSYLPGLAPAGRRGRPGRDPAARRRCARRARRAASSSTRRPSSSTIYRSAGRRPARSHRALRRPQARARPVRAGPSPRSSPRASTPLDALPAGVTAATRDRLAEVLDGSRAGRRLVAAQADRRARSCRCAPLSSRRCAAAASASGKARSITGAIRPASISGQTSRRSAAAIRALASTDCGRSVEPVMVSRFSITWAKFSSTSGPCWCAIITSRPSGASARTSRGR